MASLRGARPTHMRSLAAHVIQEDPEPAMLDCHSRRATFEGRALVAKVLNQLCSGGGQRKQDMLARKLERPLSEREVRDALADMYGGNDRAWVGSYSELRKELDAHNGDMRAWLTAVPAHAAIVLHRWKPTYGHWTCCFLQPNGDLQLFDSTAAEPDTLRTRQSAKEARALGQDKAAVVAALRGMPAHYNDHKFQDDDAQTCGRWCLLRIALPSLTEDEFTRIVSGLATGLGVTPDLVAIAATS